MTSGRAEGMGILELNPFAYLIDEYARLLVAGTLNVKLPGDKLTQSNVPEDELLDLAASAEMMIMISDITILQLL